MGPKLKSGVYWDTQIAYWHQPPEQTLSESHQSLSSGEFLKTSCQMKLDVDICVIKCTKILRRSHVDLDAFLEKLIKYLFSHLIRCALHFSVHSHGPAWDSSHYHLKTLCFCFQPQNLFLSANYKMRYFPSLTTDWLEGNFGVFLKCLLSTFCKATEKQNKTKQNK